MESRRLERGGPEPVSSAMPARIGHVGGDGDLLGCPGEGELGLVGYQLCAPRLGCELGRSGLAGGGYRTVGLPTQGEGKGPWSALQRELANLVCSRKSRHLTCSAKSTASVGNLWLCNGFRLIPGSIKHFGLSGRSAKSKKTYHSAGPETEDYLQSEGLLLGGLRKVRFLSLEGRGFGLG